MSKLYTSFAVISEHFLFEAKHRVNFALKIMLNFAAFCHKSPFFAIICLVSLFSVTIPVFSTAFFASDFKFSINFKDAKYLRPYPAHLAPVHAAY